MKLTIKSITVEDYGTYKCLSRNALGDTDGTIKIYRKFIIIIKFIIINNYYFNYPNIKFNKRKTKKQKKNSIV